MGPLITSHGFRGAGLPTLVTGDGCVTISCFFSETDSQLEKVIYMLCILGYSVVMQSKYVFPRGILAVGG